MKHTLGSLLAVGLLVLAGCGDASSSGAADACDDTASCVATSATPSPGGSDPTVDPGDGVQPTTIAIVHQTAVGGKVDQNAVPIDDAGARADFTAQFTRPSMDRKIAQAVAGATVPEGYTVMGAVVSIGCDVPPSVTVSQSPDGWVVTPDKAEKPLQECFAPVTSVAVVAVPA